VSTGSDGRVRPPRLAESLLTRLLPRGPVGQCILGDLEQEFHDQRRISRRFASRWYWLQTLTIGWHYAWARPGGMRNVPSRFDRKSLGRAFSMETLLQNLRYTARSSLKTPGFSLTVIALIGLGVGATTTIFSVVDNVLLRRLPYPESERLVFFDNPAHSVPLYRDWRDRTSSFSMIGGFWDERFDLTGDGTPEKLDGAMVTEQLLPMLGARPELGRMFVAGDFVGVPAGVVMISHGLWQRRWGGDPDVVGRTITLSGFPTEIVGVVDANFAPPAGSTAELWLPLDVSAQDYQRRGLIVLAVIAQLRSGVSLRAAQEDVDRLSLTLAEQYPDFHRRRDGSPRMYSVISLMDATVGDVSSTLFMVLGAVGLMLLVACANVANLFLARGTDRAREMALRAALGAGRARLITLLLTESVALALVGGLVGIGLAVIGVSAFELYNPGGIPRMESIGIDLRVLGFAMIVSVATGVLFGIVPALNAARADVREALSETGSQNWGRRRSIDLRNTLVVAEIATALILLAGAGLLFRSFVRLSHVDTGFSAENVLVLPLEIGDRFEGGERVQFTGNLLARIAAIPGVAAVGAGTTVPPTGRYMCCWGGAIRNEAQAEFEDPFSTIVHPITLHYFDALGARIVRGRGFTQIDDDPALGSAIINESAASYLFGAADPVGQRFWFRDLHLTVIGVVHDIRHWHLNRAGEYNVYVPYRAYGESFGRVEVAVKANTDQSALAGTLRDVVWSIDGDLPVGEITPLRRKVAQSIAQPRFLSILLLTFSTLAMLLAAGGIYGLMLYSVRQRRREMGIRMALGAGTGNVVGLIVRRGLLLTAIGLVVGFSGALALARTLQSLLFGITPADPGTFAIVSLILGVVALTACYLPARRAAACDPIETLKVE
jgi:putative ABC transport system permease protein